MLIQSLRRRASSIVGNRRGAGQWTTGEPFGGRQRPSRHAARLGRRRERFVLLLLVAATQTHRSEPLQKRHALLLRVLLVGDLAALGANFILRRHRQFIDSRHAQSTRRDPFRLRRNEVIRLFGLWRILCRIDEQ